MFRFMGPLIPILPWVVYGVLINFSSKNNIAIGFVSLIILILCNFSSLKDEKYNIAFMLVYIFCVEHPYIQNNSWLIGPSIYLILIMQAVISLLIKQPFTIKYAKSITPKEYWEDIHFLNINTHITALWVLIFGICFCYTVFLPSSAKSLFIASALIGGAYGSSFYPHYYKKKKGLL